MLAKCLVERFLLQAVQHSVVCRHHIKLLLFTFDEAPKRQQFEVTVVVVAGYPFDHDVLLFSAFLLVGDVSCLAFD